MAHERAGGQITTRTKVRTPFPEMGNLTVDGYQVPRDWFRKKSGSKYFPGGVNMYTMRIDEYEVCMSFRNIDGMAPADGADVGFLSHTGTAVFSSLNGIEYSKFWMYNKTYPVGISKTHTKLDDRGTNEFSQLAIFVAGSTTVVNNGLYSIAAGSEVKISFYDMKNDRDTFEKLFHKRGFMDGDDYRVVPVIEPYYREDDMVDMLNLHLPLLTGETSEEEFRVSSGLEEGEWNSRDTFPAIVGRLHESVVDTMLFGAFAWSMFNHLVADDPESSNEVTMSNISEALYRGGDYIDELYRNADMFKRSLNPRGKDISFIQKSFGRTIAKMLYSRAPGHNIAETLRIEGEALNPISYTISMAQRGVRKSLLHQRELIMWERRWVIGTALSSANPGERLWLKIHRGCY
jgi:hypothetical protein